MECNNGIDYREKATILLEKGDIRYSCECVDSHDWSNMFHLVTLHHKTYLCFRKTLYGFTLLNVDSLTEEYDYFPETVINGEESFIILGATSFHNIVIFNGCYWACPNSFFAYDHDRKLFLNLSDELGICTDDGKLQAEEDTLVLTGENENGKNVEVTVTLEELCRLLKEKGTHDF